MDTFASELMKRELHLVLDDLAETTLCGSKSEILGAVLIKVKGETIQIRPSDFLYSNKFETGELCCAKCVALYKADESLRDLPYVTFSMDF